jgi:glycosyltransferase involved in cell wall biosynthesis
MIENNMDYYGKLLHELKDNPKETLPEFLAEIRRISRLKGIQTAYNSLLRADVYLDLRKPTLGIYDHAFHFIGGAQKYGLSLISTLQSQFDITIISNKKVSLSQFKRWYDLDLSHCDIKTIKLPYYEKRGAQHFDPALISHGEENPFHPVSKESGNYDIFINNSMNEMVYPLSNISVLVCHFPERRPKTYFYADQYTHILYNSLYTAQWIKKKWGITPHEHVYPPVDMESRIQPMSKNKTIISVARFEVEGTKKQLEMIETFLMLKHDHPKVAEEWTLKLVGGTSANNPYLRRLEKIVAQNNDKNIQLRINIPLDELKSLYQKATLFWHLCGLGHADPSEIEHFGMTTVEAMQNRVIPIVYDGGGLREIVDHGVNGFRVRSKAELRYYTLLLFQDEKLVMNMGEKAQKKSYEFSRSKFEERIGRYFGQLLSSYRSP